MTKAHRDSLLASSFSSFACSTAAASIYLCKNMNITKGKGQVVELVHHLAARNKEKRPSIPIRPLTFPAMGSPSYLRFLNQTDLSFFGVCRSCLVESSSEVKLPASVSDSPAVSPKDVALVNGEGDLALFRRCSLPPPE